ncbi:MAG: PadR family transcriptional regulator, partial [Alphaproteobacteria bacterium]|nr:PadR family transcriptional regulator [Alphaproteobacteria bacterium]
MSLPHILLGVLDQPRSGYDIKQLFDSSLKH